ncbi:hypothetical protein ACOMHN_048134 [Nucella lapillus]
MCAWAVVVASCGGVVVLLLLSLPVSLPVRVVAGFQSRTLIWGPTPGQAVPGAHEEWAPEAAFGSREVARRRGNPIIPAGIKMFTELEDLTTRVCENCSETYQCHTSDKDKGVCKPCHGKARRAMFAPSNDLTPTPAPPCLSDLTQVEKSAISIICPSIAIHKKGTGSASKGHTIAFFQDVETFASILPRVPDELPFIVLKDPSEKIEDRSFRVRKQKLLDALLYLKSHNEDYRHIVISRENADLYPEDDIIQSLPQLDPQEMKIPDEEPTAANEDSAREQASTVDIPGGQLSVVEKLRSVLQKGSSNDAPAATEECPRDAADPPQQVPWPKRSDAPCLSSHADTSVWPFLIFFQTEEVI